MRCMQLESSHLEILPPCLLQPPPFRPAAAAGRAEHPFPLGQSVQPHWVVLVWGQGVKHAS